MRNNSAPESALAVAVVIWGSTFVVSDTALETMSPAVLTVARFAVALMVLGPAAAARGGVVAMIRSAPVALLGATGVAAYYGLQNLGLVTTGAGTAAVLQAILPVATGASIPAVGYLCAVITGEPSSWAKTVGSVLALLGAGIAARAASPVDPPESHVVVPLRGRR